MLNFEVWASEPEDELCLFSRFSIRVISLYVATAGGVPGGVGVSFLSPRVGDLKAVLVDFNSVDFLGEGDFEAVGFLGLGLLESSRNTIPSDLGLTALLAAIIFSLFAIISL